MILVEVGPRELYSLPPIVVVVVVATRFRRNYILSLSLPVVVVILYADVGKREAWDGMRWRKRTTTNVVARAL